MEIRIDGTEPVCLTVSEDYDGVNPPAAVTLLVRGHDKGQLGVHVVGGDPQREDEDTDKPTLIDGTYSGDKRTFASEEGPILHHLIELADAVAMGNTEPDDLAEAANRVLSGSEPFPEERE